MIKSVAIREQAGAGLEKGIEKGIEKRRKSQYILSGLNLVTVIFLNFKSVKSFRLKFKFTLIFKKQNLINLIVIMETTKTGSKTNLNESNVPLLDEKIEMETKVNQGTEEKNEGEVKNETKGN